MNSLQINTHDLAGGASRVAYQLHKKLSEMGYSSKMLVANKTSDDPDVYTIGSDQQWYNRYIFHRLLTKVENTIGLQYWFRRFPYGSLNQEPFKSAQIVNFHNLHGDYFNYLAIPRITRYKAACWSLHDMWSLTGHCTYSFDCERWITGCGSCPQLKARGEIRRMYGPERTVFDRSRLIWSIKKKLYSRSRLTVITGSNWMKDLVKQSILAEYSNVVHIPYGIDVENIRPIEHAIARDSLRIPRNVPVVLVCGSIVNARKGLKYAIQALKSLQTESLPWIISFGQLNALKTIEGRFRILDMGFLHSTIMQNLCYSAADVFLLPTLADNLPLMALDSLSSGTPIIAFDVGGMSDPIRHMETGYLADYKDTEDIARGIQLILGNPELRDRMSRCSREVAVQEYSLELQAKRYAALYEALIAETEIAG